MKLLTPIFLFIAFDLNGTNFIKDHPNQHCIRNTTSNNTFECRLCEGLVDIIDHDMKFGNETFSKIRKVIEFICDETTDPIGNKECHIVLDDLQTILNWLTRGMPTSQICHRLGFCNQTVISVT